MRATVAPDQAKELHMAGEEYDNRRPKGRADRVSRWLRLELDAARRTELAHQLAVDTSLTPEHRRNLKILLGKLENRIEGARLEFTLDKDPALYTDDDRALLLKYFGPTERPLK